MRAKENTSCRDGGGSLDVGLGRVPGDDTVKLVVRASRPREGNFRRDSKMSRPQLHGLKQASFQRWDADKEGGAARSVVGPKSSSTAHSSARAIVERSHNTLEEAKATASPESKHSAHRCDHWKPRETSAAIKNVPKARRQDDHSSWRRAGNEQRRTKSVSPTRAETTVRSTHNAAMTAAG